ATLTRKSARLIAPQASEDLPTASSLEVTAAECPLYTARRISGVKVAPSPAWLRTKLEAVGLRPINNVVDVTNYVMLELGQPLHAFDAAKLKGALNARLARDGEEFLALDGKSYKLAAHQLVIANSEKAVAIAGVMGGEESGVTEATTEIWLESAYFQPQSIRRTSRQLGLSSDSSYRFERGVDPVGVLAASQRAAELIIEIAGGTAEPIQAGTAPGARDVMQGSSQVVPLRQERVAQILGVAVAEDRIEQILTGFGLQKQTDGWRVPSFRSDLTREIDLIEEISRVVGLDIIPAKTTARFAPASATDHAYDRAMQLRRACVAQGLHEARSLTLVPAEPLGLAYTQSSTESLRRVKNPMIDDQVVLRPNLLHGLLKAVGDNVRAGAKSIRLFEIGRVYSAQVPEESSHAAIVVCGPVEQPGWNRSESTDADLFHLKGVLAAVLGPAAEFEPQENAALALSLTVKVNGAAVGFAGQLWPAEARALDSNAAVLFAEIDLTTLDNAVQSVTTGKYREILRFPATSRDIALLAPVQLAHARVESVLKSADEPLLAQVELFDVFTDPSGAKVPADKKSLAYSLTYRSADRTLTADEVSAAHGRLKERLKTELGITFRE
ncbi:MAG TPA: phenylalanine--tRNA ligase subunit beta, partial [Chthoniobacteraceae bacterium]